MEMVAVQGYDHERRVIFWNKASERLYGYSSEEAMGRRLEDLIIPDAMRDDVIRGVRAWVDGGPAIPPGELELRRKDGSMVPVYSSHVMQENTFGAKEMFCVDVDLSQTRKAMGELMRAKEAAEAANHAKSNFLANMSHEIRTPLNGILGMIQLMRSTRLAPEQDKYTRAALQSSLRLTRLLTDILDLTRVEAGKLAIHNEPFELAETFRQVADLFESVSRHSGVALRTIIDPALPASLCGDQMRLTQVLTNLAGNALKFTSQGSVTMEATALTALRPGQCRVLFRITDTGVGIPEHKLDQAFEPFSQGAEGYTRDYQGAGLGLSICKRLVGLMGGNLSIASEEGRGTSVYFSLPFGHDADAQAAPSPADTEAGPLNILLVEDDQTSSMVTRLLLEKTGHAVHTAFNGQEAVRALRAKAFDVVLMDVQMPVMDGIQATRAIREGQAGQDAATVPVVAMTAFAMTGDRERFLDAGMDGYLAKPVRMEELETALADATRPLRARPRTATPRPLPRR
jgi:PAS domain S-box-containing protein